MEANGSGLRTRGRLAAPPELLDRGEPHDNEAELGLLSCIMLEYPRRLEEATDLGITADHFLVPQARRLWEEFASIREDLQGLTVTLLWERLKEGGAGELVDIEFLTQVADASPHSGNLDYYARRVLAAGEQRRALAVGRQIIQLAHDDHQVRNAIDEWRGEIADVVRRLPEGIVGDQQPDPAANWRPFPVDALPDVLGKYVMEAAAANDCDPSMIAVPLLAAAASAIGSTRQIEAKRGWRQPCALWTCIVSDSGSGKTPAIKKATWPVTRHEDEANLHLGEPAPLMVLNDVTIEAALKELHDYPRGLLVIRDELSGWFRGFDQYKAGAGGDRAIWCELHDGETIKVHRRNKDCRQLVVQRPVLSIIGGIQPEVLKSCLGTQNRENGLAARILMAMPPRRVPRDNDRVIPADLELALWELFEQLYRLQNARDDSGSKPRLVVLSDSARPAFREWGNRVNNPRIEGASGHLVAALSKMPNQTLRLALVLHEIQLAEVGADSAASPPLGFEVMGKALRLADWFASEAGRIYARLDETHEDAEQRKLIELIERKGGRITARELQQSSRAHKQAADARAALDGLVRAGLLARETVRAGRGPNRIEFVLSPRLRLQVSGFSAEKGKPVDVDSADEQEF